MSYQNMDCQRARDSIRKFLKVFVMGMPTEVRLHFEELTDSLLPTATAFYHIRECKEEECHKVWRELNGVVRRLEGIELPIDEEGSVY